MGRFIIGITGASGSIYGIRLTEELLKRGNEVSIVMSEQGKKVLAFETCYNEDTVLSHLASFGGKLACFQSDDLFAPTASGSYHTDGMIVAPCSMSTLAEISAGISRNLLLRSADVCIKEKRKLILVPRETPLSPIHLTNMLRLCEAGVLILPAMPGFYHKPVSLDDIINFVVGKVLDSLNIENDLFRKWGNLQ